MPQKHFQEVVSLIKQSQFNALKAVNTEIINLYWNIGEHISKRVKNENWGKYIVKELAEFIKNGEPSLKGFSERNF